MDAVHSGKQAVNVAVLASGGGTNLQALLDAEARMNAVAPGSCPYHICVVLVDRKNAYAAERAKAAGIPAEFVNPSAVLGEEACRIATRDEKRLAVSDRVLSLSEAYAADAIVLAGSLTVLCGEIITRYSGRIINLHPALLPKFGGVGMWGHHVHEAVLAAGEAESGCTVHLVDAGCDTGEILLQKRVPVLPGDTPESLAARISVEEHKAIVEATEILARRLLGA